MSTEAKMKIDDAKLVLSAERMSMYEQIAQGQDPMTLYLRNIQISASFHFPLHVCEVALRNAIEQVLSAVFSPAWHTNQQFLRILDNYHRTKLSDLTSKHQPTRKGKIISELTLGFWVNLLSPKYAHIWTNHFYTCFANYKILNPLSNKPSNALNALHNQLKIVNKLRNRIAHYEPILSYNLDAEYNRILNVIYYLSIACAKWVNGKQRTTYYIKRLGDSL
jgi:hypothetical protein